MSTYMIDYGTCYRGDPTMRCETLDIAYYAGASHVPADDDDHVPAYAREAFRANIAGEAVSPDPVLYTDGKATDQFPILSWGYAPCAASECGYRVECACGCGYVLAEGDDDDAC